MARKAKVYVTKHHIDKETLEIPVLSFESVVKDDLSNVTRCYGLSREQMDDQDAQDVNVYYRVMAPWMPIRSLRETITRHWSQVREESLGGNTSPFTEDICKLVEEIHRKESCCLVVVCSAKYPEEQELSGLDSSKYQVIRLLGSEIDVKKTLVEECS